MGLGNFSILGVASLGFSEFYSLETILQGGRSPSWLFQNRDCQRRTTLQKEMKETDKAESCFECEGDIWTSVSLWPSCFSFLGVRRPRTDSGIPHRACVRRCVRPFATSQTVACQASPSMGYSSKEDWSGLSFPPQGVFPTQGLNPAPPALEGGFSALSHVGTPEYPTPWS